MDSPTEVQLAPPSTPAPPAATAAPAAPQMVPIPVKGILREVSPQDVPVVVAKSIQYLDAKGKNHHFQYHTLKYIVDLY